MLRIFALGGPVMIPLLLCSIFALAIGIERLWYLLRSRVDTDDLLEDIKLSLGQGKVLEAMQIAKKSRGPVAAVLATGIAHYDQDREEIKEHMTVVGQEEIHKMERRLGALDFIVTASPLLGILGTVTGIIDSFNVMGAMEGVTQASALSIGIAEALITTATGLIIAVPTMALASYLNSVVNTLIADMNKKSNELLNVLDARSDI
ncbi:MAG: MotA/TolQ/ExbB proton channel family protein [Bacillota bacterium]|jgi:biopolymer transport protein ExbB|nr:MotA/TolQ/ExbB proton channel family protein [Bacillota bacterium]NLJ03910.1 MotA/TolQ/ExbB proton channel family protein [Bacillota bacterium]